jgi:enoyl-CoA hydratase/carnithine racemase
MADTVELTLADGIAEIALNRPHRLNAINPSLLRDFATALRSSQASAEAPVILVHGRGRAFCAGDDLKEFDEQSRGPEETRRFVEQIQEVTRLMIEGDAIVVGAIHGWAVGGGLEWVLNCDLAVMARGCRCFFPETSLGLFVTGGVSSILPNLVGLQKAKELILLGDRFTAAEAEAWGLVARVVDDDAYLAEARALSRRVAALPAHARRNVRRVLNRAFQLPVHEAMALETEATIEGFLHPATAALMAARR